LTIFLSISSPSSGLAPSTCSASFRVEGSQPLSSVVRTPDTDGRVAEDRRGNVSMTLTWLLDGLGLTRLCAHRGVLMQTPSRK
jgi:hypothetical protein